VHLNKSFAKVRGDSHHGGGNQQLKEKEGVNALSSGNLFERTWKVNVF
jgi:hypothetical protein